MRRLKEYLKIGLSALMMTTVNRVLETAAESGTATLKAEDGVTMLRVFESDIRKHQYLSIRYSPINIRDKQFAKRLTSGNAISMPSVIKQSFRKFI